MFSEKDLNQIKARGAEVSTINEQIEHFKKGFPFLRVIRAATIDDGIIQLGDAKAEELSKDFDEQITSKTLLKFVPASGAASRMFKSLFAALEENKIDKSVNDFLENTEKFAFFDSLMKSVGSKSADHKTILKHLLTEIGLDYGNLPKGLLEFHKYGHATRTPLEEHLVEGAKYANSGGHVKLHFTVSPEHRAKFEDLVSKVQPSYESEFGVTYDISFSEQKPSADTIAVSLDNTPFRTSSDELLFRPAGHGALLENLNEQDADLVFIKNVDNVVPDRLKPQTIIYKKALASLVLSYQEVIFAYLRLMEAAEISEEELEEIEDFIEFDLCIEFPESYDEFEEEERLAFCIEKLNRPLRVCGMVKNVGEPGGGPFWAENADETISLQVVESAQIDLEDPEQKEIFQNATHFNPVDLICTLKDFKGNKFNLLDFRDPQTGFITQKSQSGKELKAQELPGLWNGAMANWNTLFVEVPLITFNPVKTVNDLLRPEHQ